MKHIVHVIFGDASSDVLDLSQRHHVWLEKCETNKKWCEIVWKSHEKTAGCGQLSGMTLFNSVGPDKNAGLIDLLAAVDEHHAGFHGQCKPWKEIHIRGISSPSQQDIALIFPRDSISIIDDAGSVILRRR
jgi:hypothetical protein